jgi:hypothetical protein
MAIQYYGTEEFDDICSPVEGKSDWGVDTLTRRVRGARTLLGAYVFALAQGQVAPSNGNFYLQSWEPDDSDPVWGNVVLQYKGFKNGTIPAPVVTPRIVEASGSSSHYFDPPYDWGGDEDAVSAVMEYTYYAGETVYRYITNGQPVGPSYGLLQTAFVTLIKRSRITLDDGTVFGGNAPVGIVSAVTPVQAVNTVGFTASPIHGTPYWEAEDIVRGELIGG